MNIELLIADYNNCQHAQDIGYLLNFYAEEPMGGGESLPDNVIKNVAAGLSKTPNAFSVLCYVDNKPAGLANCFESFSTFKCKPLINIHDLMVESEFRGLGISQMLLKEVEGIAQEKDCCKVTLEVLEGNKIAQNAYLKFGYEGYELNPEMGKALFWQKSL